MKLPGDRFSMAIIMGALEYALKFLSTNTEQWRYRGALLSTFRKPDGWCSIYQISGQYYIKLRVFPIPWRRWIKTPVKLTFDPLSSDNEWVSTVGTHIENPDGLYAKFEELWEKFIWKLEVHEQARRQITG